MRPLNILLICDRPRTGRNANTIIDHIDSFARYSKHRIFTLSHRGDLPQRLRLGWFDAIVIHYSIYCLGENYLSRRSKEIIRNFPGLKIQFIQDEYRTVNAIIDVMEYLKLDVLFTCIPTDQIRKVYDPSRLPNVTMVNTLTGFVPPRDDGIPLLAISERPLHVGYRARKLPYWYGELALEKWRIVDGFAQATGGEGLKCDLSYDESKRLYGKRWVKFLTSCKATLGVESGASVIDFTGDVQRQVERHQKRYPKASFGEVRERFFKDLDGKIRMNQISPRCFEASTLKTAMILFEGGYSDILKPYRHYIPLRKDFRNIRDVVQLLKNDSELQKIADTAYEEIALNPNYSYKSFVLSFDSVIEKEFAARKIPMAGVRCSPLRFAFESRVPTPREFAYRAGRRLILTTLRVAFQPVNLVWKLLPHQTQEKWKPSGRHLRRSIDRFLRINFQW